jgi:hypothetical protein
MLNLGRHHQNAYVTNDLDRALKVYADHYGVPKFFELQLPPNLDGSPLPLRIALANVGGVEIELIQPLAPVPLYADVLPKDGSFAIVFHHICMRIEGDLGAWERHRKQINASEHRIALEGGLGDLLRYVYTDERSRLGHYLEHLWYSAQLLTQMDAQVPRYTQQSAPVPVG